MGNSNESIKVMKCGHTANGSTTINNVIVPACVSCCILGDDNAIIPAETIPDLSGRMAKCAYGNHAIVTSSFSLAFFEHKPNHTHDVYYCGCYGWD